MQLGKCLGYLAVDALELEAGEPTWWVWVIDDRNDLALLFSACNLLTIEQPESGSVLSPVQF